MPPRLRQSLDSDHLPLLSSDSIHDLATSGAAPSLLSRHSSSSTLKPTTVVAIPSASSSSSAPPPTTTQPATAPPPQLSATAMAARRFTASEAEYLAALRDWVEEKQYISLGPGTTLEGFYGKKTMAMYAQGPGLGLRRKGKGKERVATSNEGELDVNGRRRVLNVEVGDSAAAESVVVVEGSRNVEGRNSKDGQQAGRSRRKSLKRWLSTAK